MPPPMAADVTVLASVVLAAWAVSVAFAQDGATLRYACDSCGSWIDAAIAHLARSLRESGLAA